MQGDITYIAPGREAVRVEQVVSRLQAWKRAEPPAGERQSAMPSNDLHTEMLHTVISANFSLGAGELIEPYEATPHHALLRRPPKTRRVLKKIIDQGGISQGWSWQVVAVGRILLMG